MDGRRLWAAMEAHREVRMRVEQRYITWNEVAGLVGVAPSGLTRLSCGLTPSTNVLVRVMFWMGVFDVRKFVKGVSGE